MAEAQTSESMHEYKVDKGLCIDCNACYTNFPEVFKQIEWQGETKADVHSPIQAGKLDPWEVVETCPVDAISKVGDMPEREEGSDNDLPVLEDLGPWEERWEHAKNTKESKWEIMKRYGMAAVINEDENEYTLKMEFPEVAPIHIKRFQANLPDTLPDYAFDVTQNLDKTDVVITGKLEDPHFKNLCGKINSFPDRFKRTFKFPKPVEVTYKNLRTKILVVKLQKL